MPVVLHETGNWKGLSTRRVQLGWLKATAVDFKQFLPFTPVTAEIVEGDRKAGDMEGNQCLPWAAGCALAMLGPDPWNTVSVAEVRGYAQAVWTHHAVTASEALFVPPGLNHSQN